MISSQDSKSRWDTSKVQRLRANHPVHWPRMVGGSGRGPKGSNTYGHDIVCSPIKRRGGCLSIPGSWIELDIKQLNAIGIVGEDSKAEIKSVLGKRSFYISGSGGFYYDPVNEPVMFMMKAATSGLNK